MKKKIIIINNENDYNKLIKKLFIYKRILYYNTFFAFENNIDNEMVDFIISALNIKNRKKRIDFIYEKSCYLIDEKNKGINTCGFKKNKCFVQRKLKNGKCNGCCRKCIYQTKEGCSTKNLTCKLFNCSEVKKRYNVIEYKDLKLLKLLSLKNQILIKIEYFSKREDILKDLYTYTLTYAILRNIWRLTRNFIKLNKIKKDNYI